MLFNSKEFLIFFPIVVLCYFAVPQKMKSFWLLVVSYFFYGCWNAKYVILILITTISTYLCGLGLEKIEESDVLEQVCTRRKKSIVALTLCFNLGILFFFKYFNFAMDMVSLIGRGLRIQFNTPHFDIILPVGISFYTFQALGYTIDVYRDKIHAERSFVKYALFVSFFPQLVAGPIGRAKDLLPQYSEIHKFDYDRTREGILLMIWGFFLKIVVADRIAIFVNAVYGDYQQFGGYYLLIATILFGIQIYCDFNGYSTIAIGTAKILGIQLMENFNAPYLSISVSEFWRKWHISLTSWFRDYLYIPLGGNRKGRFRKYINEMIVFLVSGLWHGASLNFVVWGGLNGLYQVLGEILKPVRDRFVSLFRIHRDSLGHKIFSMIVTFVLIDFSWIFFRADGFRDAVRIIRQMISVKNPWILFDGSLYNCGLCAKDFSLLFICILIILFSDLCKHKGIMIRNVIAEQDYWFRCLVIVGSICFITLFGIWGCGYNASSFIYTNF